MEGDRVENYKQDRERAWGKPWPAGRALVYGTISGTTKASLAEVSPAGIGTSYLSPKGKVIMCENPHTLNPREFPSSGRVGTVPG